MDTRDRIIRSAELLFAQNGYDGTSLREITEKAGVNVASVNYHFGSKENLLVSLLDRIIAPINEERLELLDAVSADGPAGVEETLEAFLRPDLHALERLRSRDPDLPRFVSRMYTEASPLMYSVIGSQFAEIGRRFGEAFQRALPHLDEDEISFRLASVVGIVVYLFAGIEAPGMSSLVGDDVESDLRRLLTVAGAMMAAPSRR
jgi:AcrR family transcriptional regulator